MRLEPSEKKAIEGEEVSDHDRYKTYKSAIGHTGSYCHQRTLIVEPLGSFGQKSEVIQLRF